MSAEDVATRIAIKKAREENKRQQYEKRLEFAQRQDRERRLRFKLKATGFSIVAFALCTTALTYYIKPSLIQGEMDFFKKEIEKLKKVIMGGPTSGPKS